MTETFAAKMRRIQKENVIEARSKWETEMRAKLQPYVDEILVFIEQEVSDKKNYHAVKEPSSAVICTCNPKYSEVELDLAKQMLEESPNLLTVAPTVNKKTNLPAWRITWQEKQ